MEKVSYGNMEMVTKMMGKRYIQTVYSSLNMKSESLKQLLMPAGSHQFQKLTLKCHNTSFLSHLWLQLSCKFKRGFKLLGHFSSHEHLSYGCRGSNLHNVNCHEVMTYASGAL